MTSADTLSVNRLGDTIRLDEHWATLLLQLPALTAEQAMCDSLNRLFPLVRFAQLNYVIETTGTAPNDSRYAATQASLHPTSAYPNGHINAQDAWKYETGKHAIKVGVIDTGIDYRHEDFNGPNNSIPVVIGGWDWIYNQPQTSITDYQGHGTSVAGIIGARRNNGLGIAGIAGGNSQTTAGGVQLFDMKVLEQGSYGASATGDLAELCAAIVEGSAYNPATGYGYGLHVMNISSGFYPSLNHPDHAYLLPGAMRTAFANNTTIVASKGNNGTNDQQYPDDMLDGWVVSVGASGTNGEYKSTSNGDPNNSRDASYTSNYGNNIDLTAPGTTALVNTTKSSPQAPTSALYTTFNGTSAAAPHVAGVAALLLSQVNNPATAYDNLAPEDIEQVLQRSAKDKGVTGYDDRNGYGLLDAGKAVRISRKGPYQFRHAEARIASYTQIYQNTRIVFPEAVGNIAAGVYFADVYRGTAQIDNSSFVSNGYQLLDVWARNSSSNLWSVANPVLAEPDITVTHDQTWTYLTGYTYYLRTDIQGRTLNQWMPANPTIPGPVTDTRLAVTFYTYNPLLDYDIVETPPQPRMLPSSTGIGNASPNPAVDGFDIHFATINAGTVTVEVFSATGQRVQQLQTGLLASGEHTIHLPLVGAAGLYTYRLVTGEQVEVGKIVKQ